MFLIHHRGKARAHCAKRNYCCTLCGLFLYCNKISQKCLLSFLMQRHGNQRLVIMQHTVPDLCQLSEFDNLRWQGESEETTFLSISDVALTCSSIAQFNMDIIKLVTVYSFVWSFSFIVWQKNNGLITQTKICSCQRSRLLLPCSS